MMPPVDTRALAAAIEMINTCRRRTVDAPLVVMASCDECGNDFAMQPQDYNRAEEHKHSKICRLCIPSYRRKKRASSSK